MQIAHYLSQDGKMLDIEDYFKNDIPNNCIRFKHNIHSKFVNSMIDFEKFNCKPIIENIKNS